MVLFSYQVRLITYDYRICAKIPKASFPLPPAPSKNCGLNDKSLPGNDITSAGNETLAQASNSDRIMQAVHSYMQSEERERSPY
ncbi:MAG: hypothetical protein V7K41_21565 [Nostoc sp.]|uniref:hypothetical protein n=1 Tax=Nostoc sp. TaxID=1180 RepID=UPI002FF441E8